MAGFQWVVLLSLLAVASSCHTPPNTCSCKKGGSGGEGLIPIAIPIGKVPIGKVPIGKVPIGKLPIGKVPIGKLPIGKVPIGKVPIGQVPIVSKGGGRGFINLGIFVSGLSSIVRSAKDIINDVIAWKINTIFDVFHIIISLSRSSAIIIDVFISGLGTLFGNLVIAIYKILICVVGLPKIGGIIGSRDICRDDYGCKYGWRRYPGKYSNHIDILKHYGVYDARAQVEDILKRWTKGGGTKKLDYSSRTVYEQVSRLSDFAARDYRSWCQEDFSEVYFSVTLILGVFANRCRSGLGIKLVDEIQEIFIEHFRSQNIDITSSTIRIKKYLETIEESQWNGVFIDSKESNQRYTSVRQESDKENNRETNTRRDKNEKDSSETDRRESEYNEKDSTNNKETKEVSNYEQTSGQKSENNAKDYRSDNESSNTNEDDKSKLGGKSVKYISNLEIEKSSSKKAESEDKSSSNATTNTETVEKDGENRSKSSSSVQTSQESRKSESEEEKLKISKAVRVEKLDAIC